MTSLIFRCTGTLFLVLSVVTTTVFGQDDELPAGPDSQGSPTQILIDQSLQRDISALLFSLRGPSVLSLGYPIGSDPFWFARLDPIAKELELSDEQRAALAKIENEIGNQLFEKNQELNELTTGTEVGEDFAKKADALQKELQTLIEKRKAAIGNVLNDNQRNRLDQLVLQIEFHIGREANTLTSERLSSELKLTDDQKTTIMDRAREIDVEFQTEFRALVEKSRAKLRGELSAEQQQVLSTMLGESFDFELLDWNRQ